MVSINKKKACVAALCSVIMAGSIVPVSIAGAEQQNEATEVVEVEAQQKEEKNIEPRGFEWDLPYVKNGYSNLKDYWDDLTAKRNDAKGMAEETIAMYNGVITEEQKEQLIEYENKMTFASNIEKYNEALNAFNEIVARCEKTISSIENTLITNTVQNGQQGYVGNEYITNGNGLTKSAGVNYYNGRRETWYSSNVLYHYMTSQWTVGSDGVYRDADGYVIVAASDLPYGSVIDTSLGSGKVYDSGCASGTSDIYTAW